MRWFLSADRGFVSHSIGLKTLIKWDPFKRSNHTLQKIQARPHFLFVNGARLRKA